MAVVSEMNAESLVLKYLLLWIAIMLLLNDSLFFFRQGLPLTQADLELKTDSAAHAGLKFNS